MPQYTDEELIGLLKSTQEQERNKAFYYMYEKLYGSIARYVVDNSGSEEDAKDIFQDGLIVLYEKVIHPNFVFTSTLHTYLFAVCKNLWLKRLRKASKREIPNDNIAQLPIEDLVFEDPLEEQKMELSRLMQDLGEGCREILILFYFRRLSMKEIAATINLANEKVAKNKKARCLAKLRALFLQSSDLK